MFLFRFILFLVLIYLIITSIGRFIFGTNKKGSSSAGREEFNSSNQRREGDISIHPGNRNKKKINKDAGEYINYEEIKDKK
jgi:hypothetical protein